MSFLYLDERTGRDQGGYYFLGGIACTRSQVKQIAEFTRHFKAALRPDLHPHEWYLKADGKQIVNGVVQADSRDQAFARWELLSASIDSLSDCRYQVFGTLIMNEGFYARPELVGAPKAEKEERAMAVAAASVMTGLHLVGQHEWEVVIDRIEGRQATAFEAAFNAASRGPDDIESHLRGWTQVPKTDLRSDHSQSLQLVDSIIYAVSRFVVPVGERKSVLAEFERWPIDHVRGRTTSPEQSLEQAVQYFRIVPLYHHIRSRILKNLITPDGRVHSSFSCISGVEDYNFGAEIDCGIWKLCNTMWEGWSENRLLMDLSAHIPPADGHD